MENVKTLLKKYSKPVLPPASTVYGREREIELILGQFLSPEMSNVILLGEPGTGKTTLVSELSVRDLDRVYLSISIPQMIGDCDQEISSQLAVKIDDFFNELLEHQEKEKKEFVVFIDEFHQLPQHSPAAVESLKPLLARSGELGLRFLAATTYDEFHRFVEPNQALTERLITVRLSEPGKEAVLQILRDTVSKFNIDLGYAGTGFLETVYEYAQKFIPASSEPRKSKRLLNTMIGQYRLRHVPFDIDLLNDALRKTEGAIPNFQADSDRFREMMTRRVFDQNYAINAIVDRLEICSDGVQDPTKPMGSFLFTGTTGTGKTETAKQMAKLLFGSEDRMIRFDMTEYREEKDKDRFRKEIASRIWENPHSVILLDEVEKSCAAVTYLLLQILDDGRLIDEHERVVSFLNSYIIMTTNAGADIYQNLFEYADRSEAQSSILDQNYLMTEIRKTLSNTRDNKFPPELLGRIDIIAPFLPLSTETMQKICMKKLFAFSADYQKKFGVRITYDKRVVAYIVRDLLDVSDTASGGARRINALIDQVIKSPVVKYRRKYPLDHSVIVRVEGRTRFENPDVAQTKAYTVVEHNDQKSAAISRK